ncbi:MAG: peroxiredoxin family protein, partial [Fusobacteriaceae bacterium]
FFIMSLYSFANNLPYNIQLQFKVISSENKTLSEKDFLGKMTLLNFGTLDSEASIKEKILLQEFINLHSDLDINYIPIIIGKTNQLNTFIKSNNFSYDFYKDPKNILMKTLEVSIVPSSFILNENGILVYKYVGILDFSNLHNMIDILNRNSKEVFNGE